jgi:C4-dicarboxylate transporter DctQ subunit
MLGRWINGIEEAVICLLLVLMTLVVFVEVVLRFGFNTGMVWADEFVLHTSAWMVLLGASYGVKVGSHIGVDVFVKLLPPAGQRIVTLLALAACLVYCGLFLYGSWYYLAKVYRIGITLDDIAIPKYIAHSVLLIGFVLLAIRFLLLMIQVLRGEKEGFGLADEAKEALDLFEGEAAQKEKKA